MAVNYLFLGQFGNFTLPDHVAEQMETITVMSTGLNFAGTMMIQFTWAYLGLSMDNFFITGNLATTMMAAQLALTGLENTYPEVNFCYASSIAIVYLFTAAISWMFLYGVWCVLHNTCGLPGRASTRRKLYAIFGYVLPWSGIIPVSMLYTKDLIRGRLCWLRGVIVWIFMGPLYFVCAFNFLVLIFLLIKRWQNDCDKEKKVRFDTKIRRVIMCFLAEGQPLGFFWLFGLVPCDGYSTLPFSWIFVAIAGPQTKAKRRSTLLFGHVSLMTSCLLCHFLERVNLFSNLISKWKLPFYLLMITTKQGSEDVNAERHIRVGELAIFFLRNLFMFFLFYCTHKTVLSLLASHYEDTVAATLKEVQKRKAERGNVSSSYEDSD